MRIRLRSKDISRQDGDAPSSVNLTPAQSKVLGKRVSHRRFLKMIGSAAGLAGLASAAQLATTTRRAEATFTAGGGPSGSDLVNNALTVQGNLTVSKGASGATPYSASDLIIEDSGRAALQFLTPNNQDPAIYFGDPQSAVSAYIQYDHATDSMRFSTAERGSADLVIKNGKVGIGTTDPGGTRLVVSGSNGARIIDSSYPRLDLYNSGAAADNRLWTLAVSGNSLLGRILSDNELASGNWLQVNRSTTTVSAVIFPAGNVGIGTTSPASTLDVAGTISVNGVAAIGADGVAKATYYAP